MPPNLLPEAVPFPGSNKPVDRNAVSTAPLLGPRPFRSQLGSVIRLDASVGFPLSPAHCGRISKVLVFVIAVVMLDCTVPTNPVRFIDSTIIEGSIPGVNGPYFTEFDTFPGKMNWFIDKNPSLGKIPVARMRQLWYR